MSITKYIIGISSNFDNFDNSHIIIPDNNHFYADPFLFKYDESLYLFYEDWDYYKGNICCSKLSNDFNILDKTVCLNLNFHLSFPCVFQYENYIYMIPETTAKKQIQLYKCHEFPNNWKLDKILVNNIYAPDVSFFHYNDYNYLFTNDNNKLLIYYSKTLDNFIKHPITLITNARNAGKIYIKDGIIYRPSQLCKPTYGYGVVINKIIELSPNSYKETPIETYHPTWFPELTGFHTYNVCDDYVVIDGRLRIKSPNMIKFKSIIGDVYKSTDNDNYVNNYINKLK